MRNSSFNVGRGLSGDQITHLIHLSPQSCGPTSEAGNVDWFIGVLFEEK